MTSRSRDFALISTLLMAGCGSGSTPTAPTAATPVATATPVSTPVSSPGSSLPASCRALPPATGTERGCRPEASDFLAAVTDAVSTAQGATAVDPDSRETFAIVQGGTIQSPSAYLKFIVDSLDRRGLCAAYDGEELNVRNSSSYNEHFDIVTSTGGSWIKYMSTCTPALPIPTATPAPLAVDSECRLPASGLTYCDKPGSQYINDVVGSLDEVIAADRALPTPVIFNFREISPGTADGYRVVDVDRYFSEIRKRMRTRGYCSIHSGDDELLVKKGTNRLSEHFDLLRAEGYSLRTFAAACHDAAF